MQVIIRAKENDKEGQWEQKMTPVCVRACVCALFSMEQLGKATSVKRPEGREGLKQWQRQREGASTVTIEPAPGGEQRQVLVPKHADLCTPWS